MMGDRNRTVSGKSFPAKNPAVERDVTKRQNLSHEVVTASDGGRGSHLPIQIAPSLTAAPVPQDQDDF